SLTLDKGWGQRQPMRLENGWTFALCSLVAGLARGIALPYGSATLLLRVVIYRFLTSAAAS
ncbi:MAG: hypothetical protein ACK4S8_15420, partial [Alishewanella aestuarii]